MTCTSMNCAGPCGCPRPPAFAAAPTPTSTELFHDIGVQPDVDHNGVWSYSPALVRRMADVGMFGAAPTPQAGEPPSIDDAHQMGAVGGEAPEGERLAFEAWMRGHCWALSATWRGTQYTSDAEVDGDVDPRAVQTRRLWAAWRDRAALQRVAPTPQAGEPDAWCAHGTPHDQQCELCDTIGVYEAEPTAFADWLAREMPPGTIISDPHWWAPKILRAVAAMEGKK